MARPKKSITQKRALGTYRASRDGGMENPTDKLIAHPQPAPRDLSKVGKEEYLRLQRMLISMKLLFPIDLRNLWLAAHAYSEYLEMHRFIMRKYKSLARYLDFAERAQITPQLYTRMSRAQKEYRDILIRYGSSPIDRNKIVVPTEGKRNSAKEFLKGEVGA